MQKEFCVGKAAESMATASWYINAVAVHFRKKNLPVVWIQDMDKQYGVIPGTKGFEIIDSLERLENEIVIHKEYGNSFNKTDCGKILKQQNVDTLIITGFCAENCVLSTYRGALDLDFTPALLQHGVAGEDMENLRFVEKICDGISYKMVVKMLENF